MTAIKRLGASAIAVVALGALGLPAPALAGKSHHLKLYKVEQHIDIEGDRDYTISCKSGDIATDGMWRIDDVSQDNEFDTLDQYTKTVAIKSRTVPGNEQDYVFAFLPIAGGDVQGKLWVTCLENPVGPGGTHSHSFVTKRVVATQPAETAPSAPNVGVTYTVGPNAGGGDGATGDCPVGSYVPIAPGFDMTVGSHEGYGYLQENWNAQTGNDVGWKWRFNVVQANAAPLTDNFQVEVSYRCLRLKSTPNTGPSPLPHAHRIVQQYKTKTALTHPARTFQTHQVHCGEHYKGMVGMWNLHSDWLYYLGMDPRIKSRAFKIVHTGFGPPASETADFRLSCFKDRTT